jgi:hypothetical protein
VPTSFGGFPSSNVAASGIAPPLPHVSASSGMSSKCRSSASRSIASVSGTTRPLPRSSDAGTASSKRRSSQTPPSPRAIASGAGGRQWALTRDRQWAPTRGRPQPGPAQARDVSEMYQSAVHWTVLRRPRASGCSVSCLLSGTVQHRPPPSGRAPARFGSRRSRVRIPPPRPGDRVFRPQLFGLAAGFRPPRRTVGGAAVRWSTAPREVLR